RACLLRPALGNRRRTISLGRAPPAYRLPVPARARTGVTTAPRSTAHVFNVAAVPLALRFCHRKLRALRCVFGSPVVGRGLLPAGWGAVSSLGVVLCRADDGTRPRDLHFGVGLLGASPKHLFSSSSHAGIGAH